MDALSFDVAMRDAREWEKVDMREHAEGNLGIGTAPPPSKRTWVGLTDEEMRECNMEGDFMIDRETAKLNVQAKLKEKNT